MINYLSELTLCGAHTEGLLCFGRDPIGKNIIVHQTLVVPQNSGGLAFHYLTPGSFTGCLNALTRCYNPIKSSTAPQQEPHL